MEEQRLKPMVENYDPVLFKKIYQKTEGLRRKLASGIDHRRFGVDQEEIRSWFAVKFIFAYNKYVHKYDENILLGHMIRAMQFFKCRIIKAAYTVKYSQTIVEFTGSEVKDVYNPFNEEREYYYEKAMSYLREHLSDNAYMVLQLQINPPPYVLYRLKDTGKYGGNSWVHKIPDELIAEYFDMGCDRKSLEYIRTIKGEIKEAVSSARSHFQLQATA